MRYLMAQHFICSVGLTKTMCYYPMQTVALGFETLQVLVKDGFKNLAAHDGRSTLLCASSQDASFYAKWLTL